MMRTNSLLLVLLLTLGLAACGPSAAKYNNEGNSRYDEEAYDEAMENYTLAQRENPDLAEPYYNAGNALHRQGDLESATNQTQQALRMADEELAPQGYYNLGNTYFQAQDFVAAIEAYKQALRLNPDDEDAKNNLELALQMLRQQQQQSQQSQQNQQQQQGGGESDQQQQQQQPSEGEGQQQQEQQQQQGNGQSEQEPQEQQGGGEQPEEQQEQPGQGRLSQEEAQRLLDALGQNTQTLQERLQQKHYAPGMPPVQDW